MFSELIRWMTGKAAVAETPAGPPPANRRRFPRLGCPEGSVQVEGTGKTFRLVDLGSGGVRLRADDGADGDVPASDRPFRARLLLGAIHLEAGLRVSHRAAGDVGCAFADLQPGCARILGDFLKPRLLGRSLQEIDASLLKNPDPAMRMRWFQGDEETQLFLWQEPTGAPRKEEFAFLGYTILLDLVKGVLQTGAQRDTSPGKAGFGRSDQSAVAFFATPSYRALRLGGSILESSTLPPEAGDPLGDAISREMHCLFRRVVLGGKDSPVTFVWEGEPGTPALPVVTLCVLGISLLRTGLPAATAFPEGRLLSGRLVWAGGGIPAACKVVHADDQVVGGGLQLGSPQDRETLAAFLAPRILGRSLDEVPPPTEIRPFSPPGSRAWLFVGVHNTHLLALVAPGQRLVYGRLCFMDRVLVYDRNTLTGYACPRGIVFPSDWELPLGILDAVPPADDPAIGICHQILEQARLPEEVRSAWTAVLPPAGPPAGQPQVT
ncbi:MAG: hypothetical protein GX442_08770 [Candidatus Riflebacteria bacterium]|nr:hypothetical protein [Candidatus Riflebacteria bacterium]